MGQPRGEKQTAALDSDGGQAEGQGSERKRKAWFQCDQAKADSE